MKSEVLNVAHGGIMFRVTLCLGVINVDQFVVCCDYLTCCDLLSSCLCNHSRLIWQCT